jgi:hypothetical protein
MDFDQGVWSTRNDPPMPALTEAEPKQDLEGDLYKLIGATQILQREMALAIVCHGQSGGVIDDAIDDAFNCLAVSTEGVSNRVDDLRLTEFYSGPALVAASSFMHAQLGLALNAPEDQKAALEALQTTIGEVSKLAVAVEAEYIRSRYGRKLVESTTD